MHGFYGNGAPPTFLSMVGALRGIPQGNPFLRSTPATVFPLATSPNRYEELISRQRMVQSQLGIFGGCPPASMLSNQLPGFPWGSLSPTTGNPAASFGFGLRGLTVRETAKKSWESPTNEIPEVSTPKSTNKKQPKSPVSDEKKPPPFNLSPPQSSLTPSGGFPRNLLCGNSTQLSISGKHLNPFSTFLPAFRVPR